MITAAEVANLLTNSAYAHIYDRRQNAPLPVVKLIAQTTGGIAIQKPDGTREAAKDAAMAAQRVNALMGHVVPRKAPIKPFTFKPRHLGGLHVFFTTDENQVLVLWRYREPGSAEIGEASGTFWAVAEEGNMQGSPDLSERQRAWLESLRPEVDAWCDELSRRGLNQNTGGTPTRAGAKYAVPVNTRRQSKTRIVRA